MQGVMPVGVVSDASARLEHSDYDEDFVERQRRILREEEFASIEKQIDIFVT
ncbi:MAG: hypothetical protein C5S48_08595 [Candidatus Methanogaster sp.]|nr:MAG: hypothetical protein C5S48_08595 [ANME-2 cluster archaeon]